MGASNSGVPDVGIFTRTLVRSPVIRQILPVRLRNRDCNDVVLVGSDFIHIKEIGAGGHLRHIATKSDFDARILAVQTFSITEDHPDDNGFIKVEIDRQSVKDGQVHEPPQLLVLTLDCNEILFVYVPDHPGRTPEFVQQHCPIATSEHTITQPGHHLAVDHRSRAMAVAAYDANLVIYAAKPKQTIRQEINVRDENWCPVAKERIVRIDGTIVQMDFMHSPEGDEDHVILLLIVVDRRRLKAIRIDWYGVDLEHVVVHAGQTIGNDTSVPNLLIPLRHHAAFFLSFELELKMCRGLLTSSIESQTVDFEDPTPVYPGSSPKFPRFASWAKPPRGPAYRQSSDALYLAREDGRIYSLNVSTNLSVDSSHAADFECHVGSAFACLGDSVTPDVLAIPGDMSTGIVQAIGAWQKYGRLSLATRKDTMLPKLVEHIPNWASVTDMTLSSLPRSSSRAVRSRDSVFVTSGRQPYGAITELRQGLEISASRCFIMPAGDLRSVVDAWLLPDFAGRVILLLAFPSGSRLLLLESDFAGIDELGADEVAFILDARTLAAWVISDKRLVQVTETSLCVTSQLTKNFEDTHVRDCQKGQRLTAAALLREDGLIAVVEISRADGKSALRLWQCAHAEETSGFSNIGDRYLLPADLTCLTALDILDRLFLLAGTVLSTMEIYEVRTGESDDCVKIIHTIALIGVCESIVVLTGGATDGRALLLCGLRNGQLEAIEIAADDGQIVVLSTEILEFGVTTAKVTADPQHRLRAFLACGLDFCLLSWDGDGLHKLSVQSVWVIDKERPELAQGSVAAVAWVPQAEYLSSEGEAGSMLVVAGDECALGRISENVLTVPRKFAVSGTPNRVLYSEQHRCIVSASIVTEVRDFPSDRPHAPPEEKRQTWPVIDFISALGGEWKYTYNMQPSERVYALLEWSYSPSPDRTYSFIVIGGSRIRRDGAEEGKITFIQASSENKEVVSAKEAKTIHTVANVTALALLDRVTIVASVGESIVLYRFAPDRRRHVGQFCAVGDCADEASRWEDVCPPFKLATGAVQISTADPMMYVTTMDDSHTTLRVLKEAEDGLGRISTRLVNISQGARAHSGLSHLVVDLSKAGADAGHETDRMVLMSTKNCQIIGLRTPPSVEEPIHSHSAHELFEAVLPRSLTRLWRGNIRPSWKPDFPIGVLADSIVGCASDGTIVGIALIDEKLWRRLSWVQRLCERSDKICPGRALCDDEDDDNDLSHGRESHSLPMGLNIHQASQAASVHVDACFYPHVRPTHMHIDGDVFSRLLERGGAETLRQIMMEQAKQGTREAVWLREHLDDELELVDAFIKEVEILLDGWI